MPGFDEMLSVAINRRGLTLEALSRALRSMGTPASIATLSYWQTGRSLPSRASSVKALANLEKLLDVAPGDLVGLLPGQSGGIKWQQDTKVTSDDAISKALAELGIDLTRRDLVNLVLHDSLTVSIDGLVQRRTTHQLVRAATDGVSCFPVTLNHAGEGAPGLEAGPGCTLGRSIVMEEASVLVAEMVLPHPLATGELAQFEYTTLWQDEDGSEDNFQRVLRTSTHYLVLDVLFEGAPPAEALYLHHPDPAVELTDIDPEVLPSARFLQKVVANAEPGTHALAWRMHKED